ncbi:MAG: hypothetical protein R3C14_15700 [Caldilineaceae bacterium]
MLKILAYAWGQLVGRYYRWTVPSTHIHVEGERPDGPAIWVGWHATQLLGVVSYHQFGWQRSCRTFIAPGLVGAVARGYVESGGLLATPLPTYKLNPHGALRQMALALQEGHDVVVAVDGPSGPAGRVRPGALWLARFTGCPIIPVGTAASPSIRLPRWDRLVMPLPGAKVVHIFGQPIRLSRKMALEEQRLTAMQDTLNELTQRAWARLGST